MPEALADAGRERVIDLLTDHLCRAGVVRWPGTDGMTLEDVVFAAYRAAATAGHLPSPAELAERHPALAGDIRRYFDTSTD